MGGMRTHGTRLLYHRINYYDGHPPPPNDDLSRAWHYAIAKDKQWHVVRHQPKAPTWAASTHALGTVRHLVKYQLVATHAITKVVVKITVWQCSARCLSEIQTDGLKGKKRCWQCRRFTNASV